MATLAEKLMLVELYVSIFTGRKHDRAISDEVAAAHGAAPDAGRYNKLTIAKEALAKTTNAAGALRLEHYRLTLPWSDRGARILASTLYFDYTEKIRTLREAFDSSVSELVARWPEHVADARRRLNGMFRADDYPAADEIANLFGVKVTFFPLPNVDDFRVNITNEELARIKADAKLEEVNRLESATRDVFGRVNEVVSKMVERLSKYSVDVEGKVSHPFRDTLVSNIRELAEILPKLNIVDDPKLSAIASDLQFRLCQFEPEELRESEMARQTTLKAAQDILSGMAGYV